MLRQKIIIVETLHTHKGKFALAYGIQNSDAVFVYDNN